jgi:hypothetical protein
VLYSPVCPPQGYTIVYAVCRFVNGVSSSIMNSVRLSWVVLVVTELLTLRILAFKQVHSIIKYVR